MPIASRPDHAPFARGREGVSFRAPAAAILVAMFLAGGCASPERMDTVEIGKAESPLPVVATLMPLEWTAANHAMGSLANYDMKGYCSGMLEEAFKSATEERGTFKTLRTDFYRREEQDPAVFVQFRVTNFLIQNDDSDTWVNAFSYTALLGAPYRIYFDITLELVVTDEKKTLLYRKTYSSGKKTHKSTLYGLSQAYEQVIKLESKAAALACLKGVESEQGVILAGLTTTSRPVRHSEGPLSPIAKEFAVVIGITKYQNAGKGGLSNLVYADDDAKAFAALLKKQGWSEDHVKLLVNEEATKGKVDIALESWLTKAGPDDLIVLFWSGHGYPDPEDPEKVYFACHDTDLGIPATGLRMDRVRATLEERKARNVVVFADTCHAGKLITRDGDKAVGVRPYVEKMEKDKTLPKGWIFMVAADTDRTAIEHASWSNGAFTHCLLEGLAGKADGYQGVGAKDGVVTMLELQTYLLSVMPEETQKVLGVAKRPIIATSSGDRQIWNLDLKGK